MEECIGSDVARHKSYQCARVRVLVFAKGGVVGVFSKLLERGGGGPGDLAREIGKAMNGLEAVRALTMHVAWRAQRGTSTRIPLVFMTFGEVQLSKPVR